jgi:DNA-binding Lrp family transcriptional regulator
MKKEQTDFDFPVLDETDCQLLNLLQQDGKLTVRDLASKVNLSPTPVHDRIKRLETSGVINHYAAVVNREKVEPVIIFFVNIVLKEHSTRLGGEFIKRITAMKEIVEVYNIGGEFDFMIKVVVHDMGAYKNFFVKKLGELPNIARLQSIIVLDTLKYETGIPF